MGEIVVSCWFMEYVIEIVEKIYGLKIKIILIKVRYLFSKVYFWVGKLMCIRGIRIVGCKIIIIFFVLFEVEFLRNICK